MAELYSRTILADAQGLEMTDVALDDTIWEAARPHVLPTVNNPLSVHALAASARSAICRHTQDHTEDHTTWLIFMQTHPGMQSRNDVHAPRVPLPATLGRAPAPTCTQPSRFNAWFSFTIYSHIARWTGRDS